MMNSSLGDLDAAENYYEYNNINDSYENISGSYEYEEETKLSDAEMILWTGITLIICCIGFVGNGYIIWLLGFQIKRNSFTTFILNLAVADFGLLTTIVLSSIDTFTHFQRNKIVYLCLAPFLHTMYINANLLLTAISIDRCVAVLFPIWHRCSRPKGLSSTACVLLWISSFLLSGIQILMEALGNDNLSLFHFHVTAIVCLPLITFSTVVLFIKVCVRPKQNNKSRVLLMILITLLCYLILAFPLNVFAVILDYFPMHDGPDLLNWEAGIVICSSLNSSINPVIYFLVGRKKGARIKESMKVIFQKGFKEGEATGGR